MNPSNPTTKDMQNTEHLFFKQMKMLSRKAANPALTSFEVQFSDTWI